MTESQSHRYPIVLSIRVGEIFLRLISINSPTRFAHRGNTMLCPIKVNSNTIELTVHTSCYCVLDLLCVISQKYHLSKCVSFFQSISENILRILLDIYNFLYSTFSETYFLFVCVQLPKCVPVSINSEAFNGIINQN